MGVENRVHSACLVESKAAGEHRIHSKNSKKPLREICENKEAISSRAALLRSPIAALEHADLAVTTGSVLGSRLSSGLWDVCSSLLPVINPADFRVPFTLR